MVCGRNGCARDQRIQMTFNWKTQRKEDAYEYDLKLEGMSTCGFDERNMCKTTCLYLPRKKIINTVVAEDLLGGPCEDSMLLARDHVAAMAWKSNLVLRFETRNCHHDWFKSGLRKSHWYESNWNNNIKFDASVWTRKIEPRELRTGENLSKHQWEHQSLQVPTNSDPLRTTSWNLLRTTSNPKYTSKANCKICASSQGKFTSSANWKVRVQNSLLRATCNRTTKSPPASQKTSRARKN